jgi:hypothetical protein
MNKPILIVIIFFLTACATPVRSDFDHHRKKWQEANITHYRFELSMVCFCAFRNRMPLRIEVLDGEVVAMHSASGHLIAAADPDYHYFFRYATLDRLFEELRSNLNGQADQVTAIYHSGYGFPIRIHIDRIKGAADDELGLSVSGFERLP